MLDIVKNNPFRILGVFANASRKDVIASKGKLSAFARIGKQIPSPTDLPTLFSSLNRTIENLTNSESKIALPKDWIRNAQFWLVNDNATDKKALDAISSGNISTALDIWKEDNGASSFQNRIVCHLATDNYTDAFVDAEKLYSDHLAQLFSILSENNFNLSGIDLFNNLCEIVYNEGILDDNKWNKIYNGLSKLEYKECINRVRVESFVNTINDAILVADSKRNKENAFDVGTELDSKTNNAVSVLENVLGRDNAQCQLTFDKLSNAILGHGIAYYNAHLSENEVAKKVLPLFQRSYDLAVSSMQEERSRTNLQTIKDALEPESDIWEDDDYVMSETEDESTNIDIKDFLKNLICVKEKYILGKTTHSELFNDGYNPSDYSCQIDEGICLSKEFNVNIYDSVEYNFDYLDETIKKLFHLQGRKTFEEWKDFFRNIGFIVYTEDEPHIYNNTYYDATFAAIKKEFNLKISVEIFENCYFSDAYDWVDNPIYKIRVSTNLKQTKPYLDWFENQEITNGKLSLISKLVETDDIQLGKTTVRQLKAKGYKVEEESGFSWRTISLANCTAYDNGKTGIIDEIYYYSYSNTDKYNQVLLNGYKTFISWKLHFISLGFSVDTKREPELSDSLMGGYSFNAKINMTDTQNNISITIEFSNHVNEYTYAPICECYISTIIVKVINEAVGIPNLRNIGNNDKSYGIYGEKTMKQLVESPLGDANIDSSHATFKEVKNWIKKNGSLELHDYLKDWCYFRNVPTKYKGRTISNLSVCHDSNRKIYLVSFSTPYGQDGINNFEDSIDFALLMVKDLDLLGFSMVSNRLNEKYNKFKSTGHKGEIDVSVDVTHYSVTADIRLWITYNR